MISNEQHLLDMWAALDQRIIDIFVN